MTRILLLGLEPETVDFSDSALPPAMTVVHPSVATEASPPQRFLIITDLNDPSRIVLRQAGSSNGP